MRRWGRESGSTAVATEARGGERKRRMTSGDGERESGSTVAAAEAGERREEEEERGGKMVCTGVNWDGAERSEPSISTPSDGPHLEYRKEFRKNPAENHHSPESTGSDLDTTSLSFNSIVVVAGIPRSTTSSSSETTTTSSSTFSCKSHSDSPHWNAVLKSIPSLSFFGDIGVVYLVEIKSAEGVHFEVKMIGLRWVSMEFIGACRIDWRNGIDGIGFGFRSGCRNGCRHGGMGSMGLGEWEAVAAVMDELAVVDRS
ncbi:hypothetical protein Droror1_Dr00006122 [Drosera rotundifolia]